MFSRAQKLRYDCCLQPPLPPVLEWLEWHMGSQWSSNAVILVPLLFELILRRQSRALLNICWMFHKCSTPSRQGHQEQKTRAPTLKDEMAQDYKCVSTECLLLLFTTHM